LVKFGRVVFELRERTDRHTHHNTSHPSSYLAEHTLLERVARE